MKKQVKNVGSNFVITRFGFEKIDVGLRGYSNLRRAFLHNFLYFYRASIQLFLSNFGSYIFPCFSNVYKFL